MRTEKEHYVGDTLAQDVTKTPFRTDHLIPGLARRSARGSLVTVSARVVIFLLQLCSTMVLARLLAPSDFGRFAMVAALAGFIAQFRDLGLSAATVQRPEITHTQVSTLFWVNVIASVMLMLIGFAAAPFVASFYGDSALAPIMFAISATFLFGALSAQHTALLRRQMRFGALAAVDIGSLALAVAIAVAVAAAGGGHWALVAMSAAQALAAAIIAAWMSGWIPGRWRFDAPVNEMLHFGGGLTGYNVLSYVSRNADDILIGRFLGAEPLGVYSRAYALLLAPARQINGPLSSVALPALSRLHDDPVAYRRYYLKIVQTIAYAAMPIVVLLWVLAEEVVLIVLGPQWRDAATIFRVFSVFVLIHNVAATTGWVLQSMGRTWRQFKWGAVHAPVFVASCLIGLPWGALGVAQAVTIQGLVMGIGAMLVAYYDSPITLKAVLVAIAKPFFVATVLFVVAQAAYVATGGAVPLVRVAVVLAAAAMASATVVVLWRSVRDDIVQLIELTRSDTAEKL